jgi:predicted MFS family arabinose efflux permease
VSRIVDAIAPPRMGSSFRWLLTSWWVTNVGDGIALAAGPLLVASQTRDPLLVALATLLQRLPWLLFGLYAGVIADRLDRKMILIVVNLLRALVLAALTATIVTDTVNVAVVLIAMFMLGTAETFVDTTGSTMLPMLVDKADLGVCNARLMFGDITLNRLAGPPIGAVLFAAGMAWPFVTQAVSVALGAVLIRRISATMPPPAIAADARTEIVAGIRWLWNHPPVRTLTLTVVLFNVTFGAAISILVLYALERLGLGALGFGLLTMSAGVGGILGTTIYGWLERTLGLANIMRIGLIIETVTHLTLAITTTASVAIGIFFVFGIHEAAWGTTASTIRQRAVPTEFQGRVASVYLVGVFGSLVVGAGLGGLIAGLWGVTAPFWFAFVGSAMILIGIWRQLEQIAHIESDE